MRPPWSITPACNVSASSMSNRIADGVRVRVDGDAGEVTVLA